MNEHIADKFADLFAKCAVAGDAASLRKEAAAQALVKTALTPGQLLLPAGAATIGGLLGYYNSEKEKDRLRNALYGALTGGATGVGVQLLRPALQRFFTGGENPTAIPQGGAFSVPDKPATTAQSQTAAPANAPLAKPTFAKKSPLAQTPQTPEELAGTPAAELLTGTPSAGLIGESAPAAVTPTTVPDTQSNTPPANSTPASAAETSKPTTYNKFRALLDPIIPVDTPLVHAGFGAVPGGYLADQIAARRQPGGENTLRLGLPFFTPKTQTGRSGEVDRVLNSKITANSPLRVFADFIRELQSSERGPSAFVPPVPPRPATSTVAPPTASNIPAPPPSPGAKPYLPDPAFRQKPTMSLQNVNGELVPPTQIIRKAPADWAALGQAERDAIKAHNENARTALKTLKTYQQQINALPPESQELVRRWHQLPQERRDAILADEQTYKAQQLAQQLDDAQYGDARRARAAQQAKYDAEQRAAAQYDADLPRMQRERNAKMQQLKQLISGTRSFGNTDSGRAATFATIEDVMNALAAERGQSGFKANIDPVRAAANKVRVNRPALTKTRVGARVVGGLGGGIATNYAAANLRKTLSDYMEANPDAGIGNVLYDAIPGTLSDFGGRDLLNALERAQRNNTTNTGGRQQQQPGSGARRFGGLE